MWFWKNNFARKAVALRLTIAFVFVFLAMATPALAHHPFGGETPTNFIGGFLSGLGHPIIGLDHFAFVVAVGLLAILQRKFGILIPVAFAVTTALGTLIHLQSIDLPLPEIVIALSVLVIGIALGWGKSFNPVLLLLLSAIAGIFHGFAYGEAIFGAEMTPLSAYLLGFVSIQLVVSAIAYYVGRLTIGNIERHKFLALRFAGCAIAGIGMAFLSGAIFG